MIHDLPIAAATFLVSFLTVLALGPTTIAKMRALKFGQTIHSDVVQHAAKQGTPTMGGILFLFGVAVSLAVSITAFPVVRESGIADLAAIVIVFVLHMALGFTDDYLSIKRGKNLGLKARHKLAAQVAIAFAFAFYVYATNNGAVREVLIAPALQPLRLPLVAYAILAAFLMVMMSNFTNLTDGLDGLASGLSLMVVAGIAVYASSPFGISYPAVAVFGWALGGALLGFLVYNGKPARIFMGDTGSLALGSSMTAMAVLAHSEIVYLVFALVFIAEGLSVVVQVISFKTTGRRVFKMSPVHHHFEQVGWAEIQIVTRFWIAGIICLWLGMLIEQHGLR